MKIISEKRIEQKLLQSIKKVGGYTIKLLPTFVSGLPDRLVMLQGRSYFVELKSTGKRARPDQVLVHKRLEKLGFVVAVIDSVEGIDAFVENITDV